MTQVKNTQILGYQQQNWTVDTNVAGKIRFNNHNNQVLEYEFYVDINSSNAYNFNQPFPSKENCIDEVTERQIDVDNDDTTDFELRKREILHNNPDATFYGTAILPINANAVLRASSTTVPIKASFSTEN